METDTKQPDANRCHSYHRGLAKGSLRDQGDSLSWKEHYCGHGEKCRATRQTPVATVLGEMRASILTPKGISQI